ncbi:HipA domain-containing protein [Anaerolentibacter hominis]|uniref:HipA domain-containing protein n=1 Tax=Anaerolentibacter hominis TaxID=3079009 RepID=UPI0031B84249
MKDFSYWEEYNGTSEGSGRSEKIWLQNPDTGQTGLFKFRKDSGTTDHISECISYQLATLLEIPCAKFELGMFNGRVGSMSYNIVEKSSEILIEGISLIYYKNSYYDPEKFIDTVTQRRYSIEMIVNSIKDFVSIKDFLNMLLFDYLIGNSDRHQSNWAIISDGMQMRWSPLYDNSSSLCAYVQEDQIDNYLGKDKKRWWALVDTKSRSLIRRTVDEDKRPTHLEVLGYLKENYFEETSELAKQIILLLTEEKISDILRYYIEPDLSNKKKELITKFLLCKVDMMRKVYFGEEKYSDN